MRKVCITIRLLILVITAALPLQQTCAQDHCAVFSISFFNEDLQLPLPDGLSSAAFSKPVSSKTLRSFFSGMDEKDLAAIVGQLKAFAGKKQLSDWMYYQLVRKTAQQLCPKSVDYEQYTVFKWYLMNKSGFDVRLAYSGERLLIYVRSADEIFDIPLFMLENRQYVCLNIHDFGAVDLTVNPLRSVDYCFDEEVHSFSYRIDRLPDFSPAAFNERELSFVYDGKEDRFLLRFDTSLNALFRNYPSVDFGSYFNIPMSRVTYQSLIPVLRSKTGGMTVQKGIDYLMQFTRYALPYEDDLAQFGKEKRLSPEQTLFYAYSDCDDRSALFFYLVRELYNLPMIAVKYPSHLTIAVAMEQVDGKPLRYNGRNYYVCEPTPQGEDLALGQIPRQFDGKDFEVVYDYIPPSLK